MKNFISKIENKSPKQCIEVNMTPKMIISILHSSTNCHFPHVYCVSTCHNHALISSVPWMEDQNILLQPRDVGKHLYEICVLRSG